MSRFVPVLGNRDFKMFDHIEKNILDLVTFEDIKISYLVDKDLQVVFTIDPTVKASTRDWVGIYPVGWTAFESCLTYQWGIGRHFQASCRTRYMIFKARDLRKAKCGSHYQFVYVSKYLDVLGVSQYFQFCPSDVTPTRSKLSVRWQSHSSSTPMTKVMSPLNDSCKLAADLNSKVFTSCGKCKTLFDFKETSFTLADKVDHLERTVADLMSSKISPNGSTSIWDEEEERTRFQKFLADIYNAKPDGSGEKTPFQKRLDAIRGLVSAMDEVIFKAEKVKSELLRMIELPCDGEVELIDPNASGILPIPAAEDSKPTDGLPPPADEPLKQLEGEPASGEPSAIQAQ